MSFPTMKWRDSSQQVSDTLTHVVSTDAGAIADGDLIIVHVCFDDALGTLGLTWPAAGFTLTQLRISDGGSQSVNEIRYRVCDGTEGSSFTIVSSATEESCHRVWCITAGSYTGTPEAAAFTVSAGGTARGVPPLSPSWGADDTGWIAVSGAGSSVTYTAYPTNYDLGQFTQASGGSGGVSQATAERALNAASDDPDQFTTGSATTGKESLIGVRGITTPVVRPRIIVRSQALHRASRW